MGIVALIGGSGIGDKLDFGGTWKLFRTGYKTGKGDGIVEYQKRGDLIFIPRHGYKRRKYGPSVTQYGANAITAWALGARVVLETMAVGTLRKRQIGVESLVIPHEVIDETKRDDNFFGYDFVVHLGSKPPFSEELRNLTYACAMRHRTHFNGVYRKAVCLTIPGDRFGTRAEGRERAKKAHIVGMTSCPSWAQLAQLGIHCAQIGFPVDVDDDAKHTRTLDIMDQLSTPERVPAFLEDLVQDASRFADSAKPLPQLAGNILPHSFRFIDNKYLRMAAKELTRIYCKNAA